MKKHEFLDLKMGSIEQYSMVVKKKELNYWKNLGWLTHTEIGLPEGDEEAWLLYGNIKKNEILIFNKPILLKDISVDKLIGLEIKQISMCLGTYGMGGAGFFGLLLENSDFLTYAVWGAGEYIIIDNKVVECDPELHYKSNPWLSNYKEENLTTYISGSKIESISFTIDTCILILRKLDKKIEVVFVKNDIRLPRKIGRKRNAYKKGEISDYILFQHKNGSLIV